MLPLMHLVAWDFRRWLNEGPLNAIQSGYNFARFTSVSKRNFPSGVQLYDSENYDFWNNLVHSVRAGPNYKCIQTFRVRTCRYRPIVFVHAYIYVIININARIHVHTCIC